MNDMSRPDGVAGGVTTAEPEYRRKFCWHCSREYLEDDVQIIWAELNCTRWQTCPFNLTDGQP